jgi:hypothetical protein
MTDHQQMLTQYNVTSDILWVPYECYSRKVSCALNLISRFFITIPIKLFYQYYKLRAFPVVCFRQFRFSFWGGKEGGPRFKFNFYFLGGGHFKYLYLCGGTPKIIKILVVVPQIIARFVFNWYFLSRNPGTKI